MQTERFFVQYVMRTCVPGRQEQGDAQIQCGGLRGAETDGERGALPSWDLSSCQGDESAWNHCRQDDGHEDRGDAALLWRGINQDDLARAPKAEDLGYLSDPVSEPAAESVAGSGFGRIQFLDAHLINQIAAGEVVERPCSVIKELVENALDAGATALKVVWKHGGQTTMRVEDDGIGMTVADMKMAVQRHTTSKLPHGDLHRISTFGFRGEALAAIASTARVTISSRARQQADDLGHGWRIHWEAGRIQDISPVPMGFGTVVEVNDLFFATPARLKFMRSATVEHTHILDVLQKIALIHPDVSLTLAYDQKTKVYPVGLQARLATVLGSTFLDNCFQIYGGQQGYEVRGWISVPTFHRSSPDHQFFFVGTRPIRDKMLSACLKAAYGDTLVHGRHSVGMLWVDLPPGDVDINVHPAKTEVRFRDPRFVRGLVTAVIRQGLIGHSHRVATVRRPPLVPNLPSGDSGSPSFHGVDLDTGIKGFESCDAALGSLPNTPQEGGGEDTQNSSSWAMPAAVDAARDFTTDEAHRLAALSCARGTRPGRPFVPTSDLAKTVADRHFWAKGAGPATSGFSEVSWDSVPDKPSSSIAQEKIDPGEKGLRTHDDERTTDLETGLGSAAARLPLIGEQWGNQGALSLDLGVVLGQIHGTYIVARNTKGLVLIDPHAAHERIVFEAMKQGWQDHLGTTQPLLIPQKVTLTPCQAARLQEHQDTLRSLGFSYVLMDQGDADPSSLPPECVTPLASDKIGPGGYACIFHSLPVIFKPYEAADIVDAWLSCFEEESDPHAALVRLRDNKMANWACKQSLKLGQEMSFEEMNALLRTLEGTPNSAQCNHGRPVYRMWAPRDLQGFFERR